MLYTQYLKVDRHSVQKNYRPITLMNIVHKILVKIVNDLLLKMLEDNNVFSEAQAGFRPNRNTWQKILQLKNLIELQNSRKKPIHLIYIDLAKAYDSVEHWRIKQIMQAYVFDDKLINLLMNICVRNNTEIITTFGNTEKINIDRGVPQESPISPLLFDLFLDPLLH
jgi:retron-type reverse transcriptase